MILYVRLRRRAFLRRNMIDYLRLPRGPPTSDPLSNSRSLDMGCVLLRFNFIYGDLIRWLGGAYTDAHRDWNHVFDQLNLVADCEPPSGYPRVDYDRLYRICTEGTPIEGHYVSSYTSAALRNQSPLSQDLVTNASAVDDKIRSEEQLSYHVILPRFLWRFLPGLFLCIFRVAYRWGDPKARLCVDPSTQIAPSDTGNPNAFIPKPGIIPNENPPIFYGTAFQRYLQWLWNLRISYPFKDIIQMADDISAAFHRVLYHPDMAVIFSTVWRTHLVVPVGSIFGARHSPSFYMDKGEARSHFAQTFPDPTLLPSTDLASQIVLPPEPSLPEALSFTQAVADSRHQGILNPHGDNPERRQAVYVDDTGNAHIRRIFPTVVNCSVAAAYLLFGYPHEDPDRPPCINPNKWVRHVSHVMKFLGYEIDSRTMRVIWPIPKRQKLLIFLDELLEPQLDTPRRGSTPLQCSRVLGLFRHAAILSPRGTYKSLTFQHLFNDLIRAAPGAHQLRRWYKRRLVYFPPSVLDELRSFRATISLDLMAPGWSRPIALLIPRDPTITLRTDSSSNGLGGWSARDELDHMWRFTVQDMIRCGLTQLGGFNNKQYAEPDIDPLLYHINVLEFLAIFVELWISFRIIFPDASTVTALPDGGHVILVKADNTTAVSWLSYATRTKRANVRRIARFLQDFISHPLPSEHVRVQGEHIPGVTNVGADILSRFEISPSWDSVMSNYQPLSTLRISPVPRELLSILTSLNNKPQTEAWLEEKMTRLWTLEPPTFVSGPSRNATTPMMV